jgi:adenine-specific DNA-methyltransferase
MHYISNDPNYIITAEGTTKEERIFNVALELCITWMNRILFLKLMEGQLVNYHEGNKEYKFLNSEKIFDYDELFTLFHNVLAIKFANRKEALKEKYSKVPYLNSSLFDITLLERETIKISALDNRLALNLINTTILKESKKKSTALPTLEYLFQFLDAYDFASEGTDDIREDKKELINASVLGKIFEKINGYKDGSIFTPAFITMYMCKQSIRLAVVEKFNEAISQKDEKLFDTFEDVKNYTSKQFKTTDILKANEIINSLRICDPAVGSGHFLVSALNEIISIKAELGILADENGNCINNYEIEIINDELIITEPKDKDKRFEYTIQNGKPKTKEIQRLQKTLFREKQTIIENCLFGVDINPNSVKICSLRLWIELLKNAYYKEETNYLELETLPNIDINIKCGNSLLSRFGIDADLSKALRSINYNIEAYRGFVNDYKNCKDRDEKRGLLNIIDSIKTNFKTKITFRDKEALDFVKAKTKLVKISSEINRLKQWKEKVPKKLQDDLKKATINLEKMTSQKDEIESNAIYKNAFEWRFEFPEVLNNDGEFKGFDLIIGNPPYIQLQSIGKEADTLEKINYKTYSRTGDIYSLFYEKGNELLKNNGILSYITSNKWMRANYGEPTRKYIVENTNPLILIDFGMNLVFDNATVLSNILIFSKGRNFKCLKAVRTPNDYDLKLDINVFFTNENSIVSVNQNAWVIQSNVIQEIKSKVEKQGVKLKEWDIKINRGILTGLNEAFIINGVSKDKLIESDIKNAELIRPILRGQDIKAWQPSFSDLWLITTLPSMKVDIDDYPDIKEYLLSFGKEKLEQSGNKGSRKKTNNKWFETQDSISYYKDFFKPKLIYPNMTKFLPFVYDEKGYFTNQKCFIITSEQTCLKYLTAFLNSKIFRFCFKDNFPELLGNTFELSKVFFEQIPIKQLNEKEQQPFIKLVDQIIELKQQGKDTTTIEAKIDELVYKLYDLTAEEIKIVEEP